MAHKISRDSAFEAAVNLLRQAPEAFKPVFPEHAHSVPLPESAFTQRIRWLVDRIPAGDRVLDLGCGRGEILHFLERKRQVTYLGLERDTAHLASCSQIGVNAVMADFNDLTDPALRYACSQTWGTVLAIDTLPYWQCPAAVLAALNDRCQRIIVTVSNPAHIHHRLRALRGIDTQLPNARGCLTKGSLEFSPKWFNNRWTIESFTVWSQALGYLATPLARRSVNAKYLPLGLMPSLTARSVVFELVPFNRSSAISVAQAGNRVQTISCQA